MLLLNIYSRLSMVRHQKIVQKRKSSIINLICNVISCSLSLILCYFNFPLSVKQNIFFNKELHA